MPQQALVEEGVNLVILPQRWIDMVSQRFYHDINVLVMVITVVLT